MCVYTVSDQRGHVSSVHLPAGEVLFGLWHGAIWKLSGPPAPERMMAGRATEPVSTFPTLLNCCWRTVDLEHNMSQVPISANAVTQTYNRK